MTTSSNFLCDLPANLSEEVIETILTAPNLRIERIVSHGQASPEGFWFDQPMHEWVILLRGAARLQFENQVVELKPGEHLLIPGHRRHRVDWTTPDEPSLWLAVHYGEPC